MSDENERSVASAGSVAGGSDIVERLRVFAVEAFALPVADLVDCAADEIERLRLTDADREAIAAATRIIDAYDEEMDGFSSGAAATLRGLLERHRALHNRERWAMNGRMEAEAMAAEHEARNCQRWIPVSERLPPFDEDVLVSSDSGCHVCAYRRGDGLCAGSFEREDMKVIEEVTHWMPLPEEPT